jgi:hypothetical protein
MTNCWLSISFVCWRQNPRYAYVGASEQRWISNEIKSELVYIVVSAHEVGSNTTLLHYRREEGASGGERVGLRGSRCMSTLETSVFGDSGGCRMLGRVRLVGSTDEILKESGSVLDSGRCIAVVVDIRAFNVSCNTLLKE